MKIFVSHLYNHLTSNIPNNLSSLGKGREKKAGKDSSLMGSPYMFHFPNDMASVVGVGSITPFGRASAISYTSHGKEGKGREGRGGWKRDSPGGAWSGSCLPTANVSFHCAAQSEVLSAQR